MKAGCDATVESVRVFWLSSGPVRVCLCNTSFGTLKEKIGPQMAEVRKRSTVYKASMHSDSGSSSGFGRIFCRNFRVHEYPPYPASRVFYRCTRKCNAHLRTTRNSVCSDLVCLGGCLVRRHEMVPDAPFLSAGMLKRSCSSPERVKQQKQLVASALARLGKPVTLHCTWSGLPHLTHAWVHCQCLRERAQVLRPRQATCS